MDPRKNGNRYERVYKKGAVKVSHNDFSGDFKQPGDNLNTWI